MSLAVKGSERIVNQFLAPWIIPELHVHILDFVGCIDIRKVLALFQRNPMCCSKFEDLYNEDLGILSYEDGSFIETFGPLVPDPRDGNHIKTYDFLFVQPIFLHLQTIVIQCSYIICLSPNEQETARNLGFEHDYKMKIAKAQRLNQSIAHEHWFRFWAEYPIDVQKCQQYGDAVALWQILQGFWYEYFPHHLCLSGFHLFIRAHNIIANNPNRIVLQLQFGYVDG
jgi:hypothetical protein